MPVGFRTLPALGEKLACVTIDFETDYGDRVGGAFNILHGCRPQIHELASLYAELRVPVSAFVRTDLLTTHPACLDVLPALACDLHCHSHTHNTRSFDSPYEISATADAFRAAFGRDPVGYRAPQGVLHPGDVDLLNEQGFKFSSSVFPSYRPGKFNNLSMPNAPFVYDNGLVELPFAVVPSVRYTISLSYLKLLGYGANRLLYSTFGLPEVLVFDSHLHDYILSEESFRQLPKKLRLAWGINRHNGPAYFKRFVTMLKTRGYRFITMTDLYHRVKERAKLHEDPDRDTERARLPRAVS
jgi:peptidoglycan/xylan/chitin deacetylase (PgdA/CDA1 family)